MYTLYKFGTQLLPIQAPVETIGTGSIETASYPLSSGGAFDALGDDVATPRVLEITKKVIISGVGAQSEYQVLRGLVGRKKRLFRQWQDGTIEWATARLKGIDSERAPKHYQHIEITMHFEVYSAYWHGSFIGAWFLDNGRYLDDGLYYDSNDATYTLNTSPKTVTINQAGNAIVKDAVINITAGSSPITALTIQSAEAHLVFSGTIAAGETLVIDCGAYTVENDGVDAISGFSLGGSHAINEWLRLNPGNNAITITITGGSVDSVAAFNYWIGEV